MSTQAPAQSSPSSQRRPVSPDPDSAELSLEVELSPEDEDGGPEVDDVGPSVVEVLGSLEVEEDDAEADVGAVVLDGPEDEPMGAPVELEPSSVSEPPALVKLVHPVPSRPNETTGST